LVILREKKAHFWDFFGVTEKTENNEILGGNSKQEWVSPPGWDGQLEDPKRGQKRKKE